MAEQHDPRASMVAWLFVLAQFAIIGLMVFGPRDGGFAPGQSGQIVGFALMIAGTALGLWSAARLGKGLTPSPLPNGATELVSTGPYRWVRHPMYVAVMLYMNGVAIRSGAWLVVTELVLLMVLFAFKSRWEEAQLRTAFPGYAEYTDRTGRFVPGL